MKVFILATCRKPECLPMATLVFSTLRIGFPKAELHVDINGPLREEVEISAKSVGATTAPVQTIHHVWIESLVMTEREPFFICDTDIIFFESFERFVFTSHLAGYRIPEFRDAFAGAVARARLHPSLLYIDPVKVRDLAQRFSNTLPDGPFTPLVNLIYPMCHPFKGEMYFNDTCSLLYQAIGGQAFTDEQKNAYLHYHFGTIEDMVLPRFDKLTETNLRTRRQQILNNPASGRGAWREQDLFFANNQV